MCVRDALAFTICRLARCDAMLLMYKEGHSSGPGVFGIILAHLSAPPVLNVSECAVFFFAVYDLRPERFDINASSIFYFLKEAKSVSASQPKL